MTGREIDQPPRINRRSVPGRATFVVTGDSSWRQLRTPTPGEACRFQPLVGEEAVDRDPLFVR